MDRKESVCIVLRHYLIPASWLIILTLRSCLKEMENRGETGIQEQLAPVTGYPVKEVHAQD